MSTVYLNNMAYARYEILPCPPQNISTNIIGVSADFILQICDILMTVSIDMILKKAPQKNNHKD
jgi:hypothetical protein